MPNEQADETFVQDLQHALRNLYAPTALRKSRLLVWLALEKRSNPVVALRETLTSAIQALKPDSTTPPDSHPWRNYWILTYCYLEQSSQASVAANLGLSDRQLRRQERLAEQTLADYLWDHFKLAGRAKEVLPAAAERARQAGEPAEIAAEAPAEVPSREQELEWLHESLPTQSARVAELLGTVLNLIRPLAQSLGVHMALELAEDLPPIAGQLSLARQALVNLLAAAVQSAPNGQVRVTAAARPEGAVVYVQAADGGSATPPGGQVAEALEMAQQLTRLFGGALHVTTAAEAGGALTATFVLPASEQVAVLVIDDNSDTLRLMQRYLVGTRYRFLGAHNPEEALQLAEAHSPQMIVLDVMMPGIDDWELLGRLRTHPQTSTAPIIISTILPQEQLARALGAADFIRKPVSRQTLLAALERVQLSSEPRR